MRIAVTGASGFVGAHLSQRALSLGHEVFGIDRSGRFACDITDAPAIRKGLTDMQPQAVIHLAALSHVGASWKDPKTTWRVNVEGTDNVLQAAIESGTRRVLVVSSAEVYGQVNPGGAPISESDPTAPTTPYGSSKLAAEVVARSFSPEIDVVIARSFPHTGVGQSPDFVVPAICNRVLAAKKSEAKSIKMGLLTPVRDILDVADVVDAYMELITHSDPGETYNVCRGIGYSIQDVVNMVLSKTGADLEIEVDPNLIRPVENPVSVGDNSKIAKLGWTPKIELEQTISEILATYM